MVTKILNKFTNIIWKFSQSKQKHLLNLTFEQLLPFSQSTEIQKSSYRWSIVSIYAYNVWQWLENFWKTDFWGKAKNILFLFFFFFFTRSLPRLPLTYYNRIWSEFSETRAKNYQVSQFTKSVTLITMIWEIENICTNESPFWTTMRHSHNEIQSSDDYEKIKIEEQIFEG